MKLTPSKEELKLKKLIEESKKILVTGHQRIDPDAVCSILIVKNILNQRYPDKIVDLVVQEKQYNWPINTEEVFPGIGSIKNLPNETIDLEKYDLVIVCDADSVGRCLSNTKGKTKIAVIDHHEIHQDAEYTVIINEKRSSCSEQIYITFKRMLNGNFTVDKDTASLVYFGITSDNGRFLYKGVNSETFTIVSEIYDIAKVNPQLTEKNNLRLSLNALKSLGESLKNMKCEKNYCYSFIDKEFMNGNSITAEEVTAGGKDYFLSQLVVNTKDIDWGFVIYPTPEDNNWRVSFRAFRDTENVELHARAFGGGGHVSASAANVEAESAKEALKKVLDVISQNPS